MINLNFLEAWDEADRLNESNKKDYLKLSEFRGYFPDGRPILGSDINAETGEPYPTFLDLVAEEDRERMKQHAEDGVSKMKDEYTFEQNGSVTKAKIMNAVHNCWTRGKGKSVQQWFIDSSKKILRLDDNSLEKFRGLKKENGKRSNLSDTQYPTFLELIAETDPKIDRDELAKKTAGSDSFKIRIDKSVLSSHLKRFKKTLNKEESYVWLDSWINSPKEIFDAMNDRVSKSKDDCIWSLLDELSKTRHHYDVVADDNGSISDRYAGLSTLNFADRNITNSGFLDIHEISKYQTTKDNKHSWSAFLTKYQRPTWNDITDGQHFKLIWQCSAIEDHQYGMRIQGRLKNRGCPICNEISVKASKAELTLKHILKDQVINIQNRSDVKFLFGDTAVRSKKILPSETNKSISYGLDIYFEINGKAYGIEYDGPFHSNSDVVDNDMLKDFLCNKHHVKLMRIREASNRSSGDTKYSNEFSQSVTIIAENVSAGAYRVADEVNKWIDKINETVPDINLSHVTQADLKKYNIEANEDKEKSANALSSNLLVKNAYNLLKEMRLLPSTMIRFARYIFEGLREDYWPDNFNIWPDDLEMPYTNITSITQALRNWGIGTDQFKKAYQEQETLKQKSSKEAD